MQHPSGYQELRHTADWEIEAWAATLPGLFEQVAMGMYALSGTHLYPQPRINRSIEITADDPEGLLVKFLSELLFMGEQSGLAFDGYDLEIDDSHLWGILHGAPWVEQSKEIKAVTYHNLAIQTGQRGLEVRIVFDV